MNGERKAVLFTVGVSIFCLTLVAVLVFASLWAERELVAWILLSVFGLLTLALIAWQVNEMSIRQKRYHHRYETPLDQDGIPTHLQPGEQVYQRPVTQPKEHSPYEYKR